ncbi:Vms1/Ankzf1 family peptidyl-tRNA hydrolase [Intrasporangium sp. YIM S08009]|uniref:baeRF2 domain-containing protein n=1 Tax=Intrasporangium zincisolvens TaxID=3080018 RepID=UPI002B05B499|nr:Vms1/Ankzf1 family peptidyl-tRNA hydrolase [Intrasporangium sp. YIM S08009]
MDLERFHGLAEASGPFVSVTMDVTKRDPATSDDLDARWRDIVRRLVADGAPQTVVDSLEEAALAPTGHGGRRGRLLVANADGLLDTVELPGRPREDATWGPIPSFVPAVRALAGTVPHVVVRLDRAGADVEVTTGVGEPESSSVDGGHDEIHRASAAGIGQRRFQARVQDSWERNAATVAEQLDRVVREHRPEVVVLMGDEHAMSYLEQHASEALRSLLVRSRTGGRAPGTSEVAEREATASALAATRAATESDLVGRFEEETGRAAAAAEGLEPVVEVLQRAQADEVLLVEGRVHDHPLWVGSGRLEIGSSREEASLAGAAEPVEVPADAALVWAAVCSRAGVTLVDPGQANPADGVGAVLRWSDESTPRSRIPSMPGHGGQ